MKRIPITQHPLVLRTDFSDQAAWETICAIIREPVDGFVAYVDFLENTEYADLTTDQWLELVPENYNHTFIIAVDQTAIRLPDHPLLVVDLYQGSGQKFRAVPGQIQAIENNLSIANMDFDEFAGAVDGDGVFRGFPES
jgi:Domain of unknown function (DUF6924)